MIILERNNQRNAYMQIGLRLADRLGEHAYNPNKLNLEAPVYATLEDFEQAHQPAGTRANARNEKP